MFGIWFACGVIVGMAVEEFFYGRELRRLLHKVDEVYTAAIRVLESRILALTEHRDDFDDTKTDPGTRRGGD